MREKLLEGIDVGDRIKIEDEERSYEGILMPHHRFSGEDIITIKLDNGYNIGYKIDEDTEGIVEHGDKGAGAHGRVYAELPEQKRQGQAHASGH